VDKNAAPVQPAPAGGPIRTPGTPTSLVQEHSSLRCLLNSISNCSTGNPAFRDLWGRAANQFCERPWLERPKDTALS